MCSLAILSCSKQLDIKQYILNELDKSTSVDQVFYKDAFGKNFTDVFMLENEKNKITFLPSGQKITLYTEIQNTQNQPMSVELRLKNPEDAKYFENHITPTIDPVRINTGSAKTKVECDFLLLANLEDSLTAEGKSIQAELVFRRSEASPNAPDFKRVSFTITCNSPPPTLTNMQVVKSAATNADGKYEQFLIFDLGTSKAENGLIHRGQLEISGTHYKTSTASTDYLGGFFTLDKDGNLQAFTNSSTPDPRYSFNLSPDDYEFPISGAKPNITETSVAFNLSSNYGDSHTIDLMLYDEQHLFTSLNGEGTIYQLSPPTVTDKTKDTTFYTSVSPNVLSFETSNGKGEITIAQSTQAFYYKETPGVSSPLGKPTVNLEDPVASVTTCYRINGSEKKSPTDVTEPFTTEGKYSIRVWSEKKGFIPSVQETYSVLFQRNIYVDGSSSASEPTGLSGAPFKTLNQAASLLNTLNDASSQYLIKLSGEVQVAQENSTCSLGTNTSLTLSQFNPSDTTTVLKCNNTLLKLTSGEITFEGITTDCPVEVAKNATLTLKGSKIKNVTRNEALAPNYALKVSGTAILTDNSEVSNTTDLCGVGVETGATFTLNNTCKITNCSAGEFASATSVGGGMSVSYQGTFNLTGGEISNNSARRITNNSGGYSSKGGGVYCTGTFIMTSGIITQNHADDTNKAIDSSIMGPDGGGVYIDSNGTFKMTGGTISNNTARNGGAIDGQPKVIEIGGDAKIENNQANNEIDLWYATMYIYGTPTFITTTTTTTTTAIDFYDSSSSSNSKLYIGAKPSTDGPAKDESTNITFTGYTTDLYAQGLQKKETSEGFVKHYAGTINNLELNHSVYHIMDQAAKVTSIDMQCNYYEGTTTYSQLYLHTNLTSGQISNVSLDSYYNSGDAVLVQDEGSSFITDSESYLPTFTDASGSTITLSNGKVP